MIVLIFIAILALLAGGLFWLARRAGSGVENRWRTFAASIGAAYTPRGSRPSPAIDLECCGVPVRFSVYVGHGSVMGRRTYFNSLRATATPAGGVGCEFHQLYMPDLQAEPVLVGDDSPPTRAWLAAVDSLIKTRPGSSISSDGATLALDLERKRDSIEDFQLLVTIMTKLVETRPAAPALVAPTERRTQPRA